MIDEKEVLKILKRYEGRMNPTAYFSLEADIVNIEALEQEPTTKNDLGVDCISRQAVLEQAYAYGNGLEPDGYCVNVEDIQALPSVTPQEPRKGHWMKSNIGGAKVCSVCNAHMGLSSFKFCPNCGVKMVEEQGEQA